MDKIIDIKSQNEITNTNLYNAIQNQPEMYPIVLNNIRQNIEQAFRGGNIRNIKKIYMLGCGDSYFASVSAELAFLKLTGIDTQAVEPLNFSRYISKYIPENSLVIGISNSGRVSRTIESLKQVQHKALTVAVTDKPESELAKFAHLILSPNIPKMHSGGAGTRSYLASQLCLFSLAIEIGSQNGNLSVEERNKYLTSLDSGAKYIKETLLICESKTNELTDRIKDNLVFFVGGGPHYGTAMFSAAKLLEALSIDGVAVELEEWAHLQFHTTDIGSNYILFAPPGNSYDRALEQIEGIINSGGNLTVIMDKNDKTIPTRSQFSIPVVGFEDLEIFAPLVYAIPAGLLAVELAKKRNLSMKMRIDEHRKDVNFQQIYHSKIK